MENRQNIYLDDEGHLNMEGRVYYVDMIEKDQLEMLVPALVNHVSNCVKCTTEVEELYRLSKESSVEDDLEIRLEENKMQPSFSRMYKIAASILLPLTLGVTIWYTMNRHSDNALFNKYFEVYEISSDRSENSSAGLSSYNKGLKLYNRGDYESAIAEFKQSDPRNMYVRFYLGLCYLQTNQINEAIDHFTYTINEFEYFDNTATWYMALAYLKKKDIKTAKEYLQKLVTEKGSDVHYRNKAENLLQDLDSFWR
jgi:tetratricopeptide (TPR) repeat protein